MEWLERVIEEHRELQEKIKNLSLYLEGTDFTKIDEIQKQLLETQFHTMMTYMNVLEIRIDLNKEKL